VRAGGQSPAGQALVADQSLTTATPAAAPAAPPPAAAAVGPPADRAPRLSPGPRPAAALAAVYRAQLSRARVARASLLFVATLQSLGILGLLRGVVDTHSPVTERSIVAGCSVLVVAFVALNLLAQRFGALRASRGLDYYAALPAPPSAVVLGTALGYATFTVPGTVLTAVAGALLYRLPLEQVWMVLPVVVLAGAGLAGVGAIFGLLAPRPELATLAGQLGMTVVLFLGIIPASRLPVVVQALRAAVPSTYAVDALAGALTRHPDWPGIGWHLAVCVAVAVASLWLAGWAYHRAVRTG
jgi:ABC-2 type transport system permease protein